MKTNRWWKLRGWRYLRCGRGIVRLVAENGFNGFYPTRHFNKWLRKAILIQVRYGGPAHPEPA